MGTRAGDAPAIQPREASERRLPRLPIELRLAEAREVTAMAAIELAVFSDPWPESAFSGLLRQSHARVAVALRDGEVIGYCVLLRAADEGEIANIAVSPAVRGQGVGSHLLDDAMHAASAEGVTRLFLEVRMSNGAARALYASREFAPVGRRRAYYRDPPEDALVLRRTTEGAN